MRVCTVVCAFVPRKFIASYGVYHEDVTVSDLAMVSAWLIGLAASGKLFRHPAPSS